MSYSIRDADLADLDALVCLLVEDGRQRAAMNSVLWKMEAAPEGKIRATVQAALESPDAPFRQKWLLAEDDGRVQGVAHTILLPVPPIYAGVFGPPGLIMEDCYVASDAPAGVTSALLDAAEADLAQAGAQIMLASSVTGGAWAQRYEARDYDPLTLYFAKTRLREGVPAEIRIATAQDIPGIVTSSAENRSILSDLDSFWRPHEAADGRFGAWMEKSLTLSDRDMFVAGPVSALDGYAISQPATRLHFPAAHDIAGIGVIDDYYHTQMADPAALRGDGTGAAELLGAAEAALEARGNAAALVVCPAKWTSKTAVLEAAGYANAITWYKRRD